MTLVRRETALEYFKEMVDLALEHQHVATDEMTTAYVVNLLAGFATGVSSAEALNKEPLGIKFIEALNGAGAVKATSLRTVGDRSLFVCGFFSDSLKRQLVDVDYYTALGTRAYLALVDEVAAAFAPVYKELGSRFVSFIDVLSEVSERAALSSNNDLLRLYEKWLRTGSPRNAELLVERGIIPNAPAGKKFFQ